MKDNLLIFGAGVLQEPLIRTAKIKGFNTVVLDPDNNAFAKKCADIFYCVAGIDFNRTLAIAKKYKVKGVVTSSTERPLLMMARIAEELNLTFPSCDSIKNSTDKYLMKQCFRKANLPCADGILIDRKFNKDNIKKLKFPLIIKPVDNSGSRGVIYCKNLAELGNKLYETYKYSSSEKILAEEYIDGKEISVESFILKGKTYILQFTDKITSEPPYNVEMGHIQPSGISSDIQEIISKIISRAVSSLGLDNCICHSELKITKNNKPVLIEIGARLGGDFITSYLVPLSTGINMDSLAINIAVGNNIRLRKKKKYCSSIEYFNFKSGKVKDIKNWEKIFKDKNIVRVDIPFNVNENIVNISNSLNRHGFIIARGIEKRKMIMSLNNAISFITSKIIIE